VVPRYRRRRGHPVVLTAALADAIASDPKAEDLSDAIRRNARLIGYLDVRDAGVIRNVNRPKR
jgi:CTP:molybdopterin cytidylyltransferase MocA